MHVWKCTRTLCPHRGRSQAVADIRRRKMKLRDTSAFAYRGSPSFADLRVLILITRHAYIEHASGKGDHACARVRVYSSMCIRGPTYSGAWNAKQWTMKNRRITPLLASSLSRQLCLSLLLACLLRHLLPLSPPLHSLSLSFSLPFFGREYSHQKYSSETLVRPSFISADQLDHWSIDRSIVGRRIIEIEPPSRDENNFLIRGYCPSFPFGLLELLAVSDD
jgi:hypothetical protein